MYSDREVLCFLQDVAGIGNKTIRELWSYFKSGEKIYRAEEKDLECLLNARQKKTFLEEREKSDPLEKLRNLQKKDISYCTVFDWNYPSRLRKICDAPLALYVRGKLPPEDKMTAAVIGARKHSYYGEKQTKVFAEILARQQVGVISGMAKGIDSIAQMTTLTNGGSTYAVLGCGVDICYPPECRQLYEKLPEYGGIISEYPPGTQPKAGLFPLRNRIISGLGDILLVMEARQRSGTLITVDLALEQGKEIWALPGRCDDVLSFGCNRLIAQGAGILIGEKEFEEELQLLRQKYEHKKSTFQIPVKNQKDRKNVSVKDLKKAEKVIAGAAFKEEGRLNKGEETLLSILDYQPQSLNEIYEKISQKEAVRMTLQEVSLALMELCIKGVVKQVNGNWYIRL